MNTRALAVILALACAASALAGGTSIQELARIKGQGESVIRGLGLVMGLPGTGDSGKELAMARPLSEVLRNNGDTVGTIKELAGTKSVALVIVTCTIPPAGALPDDRIDVSITTVNSASSLKGGRLYLCPLLGPRADSRTVYAYAEGPVDIEDPSAPTTGKVRGGARITETTRGELISGNTFDLILEQHFAGWGAAQQIASSIDVQYQADPNAEHDSIATVIDDRTVRVMIPPAERPKRAAFVADVLSTPVNVSLLGLPAQVVCNQRTGAIVVTGDVEISPGIITHKDLVITTTIPAPIPTPADPLTQRTRWAAINTDKSSPTTNAKLDDLLSAFKQLDIPVSEQISILQMLSKAGRLRAKLIVD